MIQDNIGVHQKLIENTINHLTWYENAVEKTGFKGISQVWIEPPVWLFWLKEIKGAFMLRILDCEPIDKSSYCTYLLHYFPENTADLTAEEKEIITSDKFDKTTNTPKFEHNTEFHNLFVTAEIAISSKDCNSVEIALVSQNQRYTGETESFCDFFFPALNFYTKSHHISSMSSSDKKTVLLPYTLEGMVSFFSHFQISPAEFAEDKMYKSKWSDMAHFSTTCSVKGTCSCSH